MSAGREKDERETITNKRNEGMGKKKVEAKRDTHRIEDVRGWGARNDKGGRKKTKTEYAIFKALRH